MSGEPVSGQAGDLLERASFLEQVGGSGHDLDLVFCFKQGGGLAVEVDHRLIASADDQEGGRLDARQELACQIGPATTGDNGRDRPWPKGRRNQRRGRTRARAEEADRQLLGEAVALCPVYRACEPLGQPLNVEAIVPVSSSMRFSCAVSRSKSSVPRPDW